VRRGKREKENWGKERRRERQGVETPRLALGVRGTNDAAWLWTGGARKGRGK